jgi:hypothetical protein|tara:strand:+ start:60 stop:1397 length:1338 start_codon:yes stop_codon:yes gene_type:complete
MLNIRKLDFNAQDKKKMNFFLYLIFFLIFFFATYLILPKLFNFSAESVKEKLKNNNDINIQSISKIDYKIFPTPRLIVLNSNFTIGEEIITVINSEIEILLNLSQILNFNAINYKKLLISKGSLKINLNNLNQVVSGLDKNKKQLTFKKNNLIFLKKEKIFLKIDDTSIKVKQVGKKKNISISGKFLKNKIFIKLDNSLENKNYLNLKIPKLDISTRVFFKKNKSDITDGSLNLEVLNNFLKFNFIKNDSIELKNGFIRSRIINSSIDGTANFSPTFFLRLNLAPSNLNLKKLSVAVKKYFFSNSTNNLPLIKKINGTFNFKSKFEGKIVSKNGEILFEDFKVGKNKSFYFNAKILEFGNKGKIQFNVVKTVTHKKKPSKNIRIIGLLVPSSSKVIFEKFLIDGKEQSAKKTKEYENIFKDKFTQDYSENFFNEDKIDKYLKDLF